MADKTVVAGVDIGGTKIYSLITKPDGTILGKGRRKAKAHQGFERVMERAAGCLEEACAEAGVAMEDMAVVGVGAPSPILPDGTAVSAPNLGWDHEPLVPILKKHFGCDVYAENDCNAGTYGEYVLGAGKGSHSLVGLFMGTGLGGGIVYRGDLIVGENCMAAEVGHTIVVEGGRRCGCGHDGCLEAYASKTGMGRRFAHEILYKGRTSLLTEECKIETLSNVRSSILKRAWEAGDEVVMETLQEAAHYLGVGVGNMITLLGPDMVVVGGGVFEALGDALLPLVKKAAKARTHPPASYGKTRVVLASLGDDAVALGAMAYACSMAGIAR